MFKRFFILEQNSDKYRYSFPSDNLNRIVIEEPFLFPCSDIKKYDHGVFVVVLTETSGNHDFYISTYIDNGSACVCFQSDKPLFELLYTALNTVTLTHIYLPSKQPILDKYLTSLTLLPSPIPGLVIYVPSVDNNFNIGDTATKVVVPSKTRQRPFSVFISELHTRLQFEDWLIIFESLLLEKWIVFHSRYLSRVTNCIFAALSLLFPLEWVHLIFPCLSEASVNCLGCPSPFVAGVHSCLIEKVIPFLSSGAVIVDIDEGVINFVTSEDQCSSDDDRLPKSLMNFLWRSWSSCDMKIIALKRRSPVSGDEEEGIMSEIVHGFLHVIAFLLGKYERCKTWDSKIERFCVDNGSLSTSRGELFQPFIRKVLQSQMVYQFLDEKVNVTKLEKLGSLSISLDDIDDFAEATLAMERWQPDIYNDVISTMASKSKRRINVFTNKIFDMAKKSDFVKRANDPNDMKYAGLSEINVGIVLSASPKKTVSFEKVFDYEVKNRENWIKFETDSDKCNTFFGSQIRQGNEDLLIFEELDQPVMNSSKNVLGIIRDFDPLFQS